MKQSIFTILSNTPLTDCVYKMVLSGDTSAITAPGQFVNIQITGKFLRRPISVCDYDGSTLTIVYKVVGKGTEILSRMVWATATTSPPPGTAPSYWAAAWVSRRCTTLPNGCLPWANR